MDRASSKYSYPIEPKQANEYDRCRPWTFKPPGRVVVTDQKREAWITDLANPTIPLQKLGSIPHGYKGEKLLEILLLKEVPINRAIWYIRALGAAEIVSPCLNYVDHIQLKLGVPSECSKAKTYISSQCLYYRMDNSNLRIL